jgi:hypothetical protein
VSDVRTYVLVEGHGETDAVQNLLARLVQEAALALPTLASPIRAPGIASVSGLVKFAELVRAKPDAAALLALRDHDDGCPKTDAPPLGARLRELRLPFPSAAVLAYREYESLFLPCIEDRPVARSKVRAAPVLVSARMRRTSETSRRSAG